MKAEKVMVLDYRQVPLKIIFRGINGKQRSYKLKPSADKSGILMNGDD